MSPGKLFSFQINRALVDGTIRGDDPKYITLIIDFPGSHAIKHEYSLPDLLNRQRENLVRILSGTDPTLVTLPNKGTEFIQAPPIPNPEQFTDELLLEIKKQMDDL